MESGPGVGVGSLGRALGRISFAIVKCCIFTCRFYSEAPVAKEIVTVSGFMTIRLLLNGKWCRKLEVELNKYSISGNIKTSFQQLETHHLPLQQLE